MSEEIHQNVNSSSQSKNSCEFYDDPLYLSSSDQPMLQLISYLFNGNNFLSWKRDTYMALITKNKDGFVDGTCKIPAKTDKKYNQWIRCDLMVMRWLLNSIADSIKETLVYVTSSQELWSEIENAPLIEYYNRIKRGWENIDSLEPIPQCTCSALDSCTCQLLKRILERESNTKLIQFLMGLNSSFDAVKTIVLTMEPLPPINKALSLLQKIERQRQIFEAVDVLVEATTYVGARKFDAPQSDSKKPRLDYVTSGRKSKQCSHCHNIGHTRDECYKLKGCSFCGRKGHVKEVCFKFKNTTGPRPFKGKPQYISGQNVYRRGANN
ncbi:hypothetical protein RND81_08G157600 [Saponaria officinalis]|uniref:Retrotransposon Copia-like N-terminal domain-containing protein n=1 Tax=Saponaria officinalis TaxID=3572 RepID=A0AAW1J883_SAPOF